MEKYVKQRDKLIGHIIQRVGIIKTINEGYIEGKQY